jgi:hypothetical protein
MPLSLNGSGGITYPDGTVNTTRSVSVAGDTMTGTLNTTGPTIGVARTTGAMARFNLSNANRAWSISNYGTEIIPNGAFVIADESAGAVRLMIDASGRFMTPAQPGFAIGSGFDGNLSQGSVCPFGSTSGFAFNAGNHFNTSNHRFTAPVTAKYIFSFSIYVFGGSQGSYNFAVNGSNYTVSGAEVLGYKASSFGDVTVGYTAVIPLNAGDYVSVIARNGVGNSYFYGPHSIFTGYLLG